MASAYHPTRHAGLPALCLALLRKFDDFSDMRHSAGGIKELALASDETPLTLRADHRVTLVSSGKLQPLPARARPYIV